jgi:hypothetical protein
MKRLTTLAVVMALMLAAAAPAFAQDVTVSTGNNTQYNAVGQNLIGTVGDISATQTGSATAVAADDSVAVAEVDQSQNVSLEQSNVVLNDFNGNGFVDFFDFFWWWF